MSSAADSPRIGQWYERTDTVEIFRVIGIDDGAATIEIQSFDGDVGEIDTELWSGLPLEVLRPPQDWLVSMEDMEAQDIASSRAETLLNNPVALERLPEVGSGYVLP